LSLIFSSAQLGGAGGKKSQAKLKGGKKSGFFNFFTTRPT